MTYWGSRDDMLWEPASDSSNLTTLQSRLDSRLRMSGMTYWGSRDDMLWEPAPDSSNLTTLQSRLDSRLRMSGMTCRGESGMT